MNSLHISNRTIIFNALLGLTLLSHSLHAITLNNQPLRDVVAPGQSLIITPQEKDNFVTLELKNDNLDVCMGHISGVSNLQENFERLKTASNRFSSFSSQVTRMSAGTSLNYNGICFSAQDAILLSAKESINIANGLLDCKEIRLTSNEINLSECFLINPNTLYLISVTPNTDCTVIIITFNENPTNPTIITGHIDFINNETQREILLTNVKNIRIGFSEEF